MLCWGLDKLFEETILSMSSCEAYKPTLKQRTLFIKMWVCSRWISDSHIEGLT